LASQALVPHRVFLESMLKSVLKSEFYAVFLSFFYALKW